MRALFAVAASALGVLCSPAGQAAAEQSNTLEVIEQLELQGYTVHLDRIGSAPLEQCVVTEIRNPQQVVRSDVVIGRTGDGGVVIGTEDVLVRQPISVSLDCAG